MLSIPLTFDLAFDAPAGDGLDGSPPRVVLAAGFPGDQVGPFDLATCRRDGLVLSFRADAIRQLDDDLACALICHELVHAVYNVAGIAATEAEVDARVQAMGFPMRRLRRLRRVGPLTAPCPI